MKTVVAILFAVCLSACGNPFGACAFDPAQQMAPAGRFFLNIKTNNGLNVRRTSSGPMTCVANDNAIGCTSATGDTLELFSAHTIVVTPETPSKPETRLVAVVADQSGPTNSHQLIRGDITLSTTQAQSPGLSRVVFVDGANCSDAENAVSTIQFNHVQLTMPPGW